MTTGLIRQVVEMRQQIEREGGQRFAVKRPGVAIPPLAVERAYVADLREIVRAIRDDIEELIIPELDVLTREAGIRSDESRYDIVDVGAYVDTLRGRLTARITNKHLRDLEGKVREYFNATSKNNRLQLIRQIRRMISIDAFPRDTALAQMVQNFTRWNADLITTMTGDYVNQVSTIVRQGVQAGDRPVRIARLIRERFAVTEARAAFIARDQVNKLNGNLTMTRQASLGLDKYIWRTSLDERVRESHLEKEGRIYKWSDPPNDTGHPGHDFNCRCHAEPYIEEFPPKRQNLKAIREGVRKKRRELREELRGKPSARLIARDKR